LKVLLLDRRKGRIRSRSPREKRKEKSPAVFATKRFSETSAKRKMPVVAEPETGNEKREKVRS